MKVLTQFSLLAITLALFSSSALAQKPGYPPEMPGARAEVYLSAGDVDLQLWIFEPEGHSADDRRPAIVFFFGGGWNGGTPGQFKPQAMHLAERGMVAIAADYRVKSRNGTTAKIAVSDAKAAIRWVRENAPRLGVDPERIAAAGGSAGGHLAAATGTLPGHDYTQGEGRASPVPNAMILFNPVLVLTPHRELSEQEAEKYARLPARLGADPESMSPYDHVRPGLAPTIIFHGEKDKTVPYKTAVMFTEAMKAAGNRCELVGYPGQGHGFFNYHRAHNSEYEDTTARMDAFLVSLGWLEPIAP
mgnify:CR=1 FL=1